LISDPHTWLEAAWLVVFLAWGPLLLLLMYRRPARYICLRTPLVLTARLHHWLTGV
jgi:hypothetical protein